MSNKRDGKRKRRGEKPFREPRLGYYCIFTNTEQTEKNYFNGLRDSLPEEIRKFLTIKVFSIETKSLVAKSIEELANNPQYCKPWIVLDKDQEVNFNDIIKDAHDNNISVAWSNPCFEIFLHGYFENPAMINSSIQCCKNFKTIFENKCGIEYKKSMPDLYNKLNKHGDEKSAIERAKKHHKLHENTPNPSDMVGVSLVYQLVEEINNKK